MIIYYCFCSCPLQSIYRDFGVLISGIFSPIEFQSGDEMSKRTKFLFVTWLGPNVSTMKRARLSSDKALVKEIIMVLIN